MNARILCVGSLKESWQKDACAEYLKRLRRFGKYEIVEVPDENEELGDRAILKEGQALLRQIRPTDYLVALCIRAEQLSSEALAERTSIWESEGKKPVFVIGGSLGLSAEVLARADRRLSFSPMTFPHQLMRVILLEQLYHAEKINVGERYHK